MTSRTARGAALLAAALLAACATTPEGPVDGERQFYQNIHVRQCLQYEKEQMATESRECWALLLRRIESEPGFRDEQEFIESDVKKLRGHLAQSSERSTKLKDEFDACLNLPAKPRDARIACFQDYLKRNEKLLSRSETFEVKNAITTQQQARERESGKVENTIERASQLLETPLTAEEDGARIDGPPGGALAVVGAPEQGVIIAVDGTLLAELAPFERSATLEACAEQPVILLIRHGEVAEIAFHEIEVSCGPKAQARQLSRHVLPPEICTTAGSPELDLGISWCYRPRLGLLEVEEVCKGSPADRAGVRQEQRIVKVADQVLVGKSYEQIAALLASFPVQLTAEGGALASPAPLQGPTLTADQKLKCWKAIEATLVPGPQGE